MASKSTQVRNFLNIFGTATGKLQIYHSLTPELATKQFLRSKSTNYVMLMDYVFYCEKMFKFLFSTNDIKTMILSINIMT